MHKAAEEDAGEQSRPRQKPQGRVGRALSTYRPRNDRLVDVWSFVHVGVCALLALAFGPVLAFLVALAWEPLEVRVLSPLLARFGIDFGHEDWKNSLSDVGFNAVGVGLGWLALRVLDWQAPLAPF